MFGRIVSHSMSVNADQSRRSHPLHLREWPSDERDGLSNRLMDENARSGARQGAADVLAAAAMVAVIVTG